MCRLSYGTPDGLVLSTDRQEQVLLTGAITWQPFTSEDSTESSTEATSALQPIAMATAQDETGEILYSGPGTEYKILDFLAVGQQISIHEYRSIGNSLWSRTHDNGWFCLDNCIVIFLSPPNRSSGFPLLRFSFPPNSAKPYKINLEFRSISK